MMLNKIRIHLAKECAKSIIDNMWIKSIDEIDLNEIAWRVGKLVIAECPMNNCEGRLVTDGETGVIRVNRDIIHTGRQRFTISHEIGHFCLNHYQRKTFEMHYDNHTQFNDGIETEANHFASELLMPSELVNDVFLQIKPELEQIVQLAEGFQTSILATCIKFIDVTDKTCLLVCAGPDGKIKWHRKSNSYQIPFHRRKIDENSIANLVLETGENINLCETVPKEFWFGQYHSCNRLHESAYFVHQTGDVISLLWLE